MLTIKSLLEEVRAYNLDTDDELDLDALADIDLEQLLGGEFNDESSDAFSSIDFDDLSGMTLSDLANHYDRNQDDELIQDDEPVDGIPPDIDDETTSIDAADTIDDIDPMNAEDAEADEITQDTDDALPSEDFEEGAEEDQDYQGEIRTVRGANLVFKRKTEDGNFEELWVYNVGNDMKRETQIRRAIIAGTDINPTNQQSEDGNQYAETSSMGNVQFLHIVGLPQ